MVEQPVEFGEVDVGDPPVTAEDDHVFVVVIVDAVLKFAEPVTTMGSSPSGSCSRNLQWMKATCWFSPSFRVSVSTTQLPRVVCSSAPEAYLAGERWSDHPACTHSLLASVARLVNDHTSDEGRPLLAELIPAVIGLTGDDLHIDALITVRCATIALPVAAADRQRGPRGLGLGLRKSVGTTRWAPRGQSLSR
jgi:hypothetical protein